MGGGDRVGAVDGWSALSVAPGVVVDVAGAADDKVATAGEVAAAVVVCWVAAAAAAAAKTELRRVDMSLDEELEEPAVTPP